MTLCKPAFITWSHKTFFCCLAANNKQNSVWINPQLTIDSSVSLCKQSFQSSLPVQTTVNKLVDAFNSLKQGVVFSLETFRTVNIWQSLWDLRPVPPISYMALKLCYQIGVRKSIIMTNNNKYLASVSTQPKVKVRTEHASQTACYRMLKLLLQHTTFWWVPVLKKSLLKMEKHLDSTQEEQI